MGVSVAVGDGPAVGVCVAVCDGPAVAVCVVVGDGPAVGVSVLVGEGPGVALAVGAGVEVGGSVGAGDGLDLVIRFGPHREDFEKDRRATTFNLREVPVPHVFAIGEAFGGAFTITERAVGTLLRDLDAAGWCTTIPLLFAALDDMRSLDVSEHSGHGEWDPSGAAPISSV